MVQQVTKVEAFDEQVLWDDLLPAGGTWFQDPMHFPRPVSPLFQTVAARTFPYGLTTAMQEGCAPISSIEIAFPHGYYYQRTNPMQPADEGQARKMAEIAEGIGRREVGRLLARWEGEHLPAILQATDRLRALDVERAGGQERVAQIDEVLRIHRNLWTIHFRVALPMLWALSTFDDFYADLFGGAAADGHELALGQLTKSVEAGIGLSDLAVEAKAAGLDRLILDTPAEEVLLELGTSKAGQAFALKLRTYLDAFGLRQDLFDLAVPTWKEAPAIAIATLQAYIRSGHDARASHERSAATAEVAMRAAREQLAAYPAAVREQFEELLTAARAGAFLQEQHNFYIDQQGIALTRLYFLRLARRFVAWNVIDCPENIFFLTVDEVKAIAAGPVGAAGPVDVRAIVDRRRLEFERAGKLTPPPFVGEPPTAPASDSPKDRVRLRFFGGPPRATEAPNQVKGNAGSRGVVRGVARVALTLDEAKALQPGEVLVTITTMPPWTPLFGTAAAVVTETGGTLSHCAIVAREYGIPAVVGAAGATQAIRTGHLITVDGNSGLVTFDA